MGTTTKEIILKNALYKLFTKTHYNVIKKLTVFS